MDMLDTALKAILWTGLIIILFKVVVIFWQKTKEDLYVPPQPKPLEDDEEWEDEEYIEDVEEEPVPAKGKVMCPYCGIYVVKMPTIDENDQCTLCTKHIERA